MTSARWPVVLLAAGNALALPGCKDALGLRELRFEEPPAPASSTVESPPATGGIVITSPPAQELQFPQTIAPGLTLFGSASRIDGPLFFAISPGSASVLAFVDANASLESRKLSLPEPPTHVIHFDVATGERLAAYAESDGLFWTYEGDATEAFASAGSPGWTTLALGPAGDSPRLLAYDSSSGQFRLGAAAFDANSEPPLLGTLPPEFDAVSLVDAGTVLLFSSSTRAWEVWDLDAVPEQRAQGSFAGTHLFALHDSEEPTFLGYDSETGKVARYSLDAENVGSLREDGATTWPRALDGFAPHPASSSIFIYNRATGVVDRRATNPLEGSPVVIK